jgi:hypothetical protein
MTREQFLTKLPQQIIYEYYKEKAPSRLYTEADFYQLIQVLNVNKLYEKASDYYKQKFNIVTLLDNKGNFIKYL